MSTVLDRLLHACQNRHYVRFVYQEGPPGLRIGQPEYLYIDTPQGDPTSKVYLKFFQTDGVSDSETFGPKTMLLTRIVDVEVLVARPRFVPRLNPNPDKVPRLLAIAPRDLGRV